jgi:hypothetical protein
LQSDNNLHINEGNVVFGHSEYKTVEGGSGVVADTSFSIGTSAKQASLTAQDVLPESNAIDFTSLGAVPNQEGSEQAPMDATAPAANQELVTIEGADAEHMAQQVVAVEQQNVLG